MSEEAKAMSEEKTKSERGPHVVHLPSFVSDEDIGLGDVIKRVTGAFGIRPCGGCNRRAAALNRWMVFTRRGK
jgi:hypothetical protein